MSEQPKPLHPRAGLGLSLVMIGVTIAVIASSVSVAGVAVGGFVALSGVIIFAASPARIDWEPPDGFKGWHRGQH